MEEGTGMRVFVAVVLLAAVAAGGIWLDRHHWEIPGLSDNDKHGGQHGDDNRPGTGRWHAGDWIVEGRWDGYMSRYSLTAWAPPSDFQGPDLIMRCRDGQFDISLIGDPYPQQAGGLYSIEITTDRSAGAVLSMTRDDPDWSNDITVPAQSAVFALATAKRVFVALKYSQGGDRAYTYNFRNLVAGKEQLFNVCGRWMPPPYSNGGGFGAPTSYTNEGGYGTTPYSGGGTMATPPFANGGYDSSGTGYNNGGYNSGSNGAGGYSSYPSTGGSYPSNGGYNNGYPAAGGYNCYPDSGGRSWYQPGSGYCPPGYHHRPWHPKPKPIPNPPIPINPPRYRSLTQEQDIAGQHEKALKDEKGAAGH